MSNKNRYNNMYKPGNKPEEKTSLIPDETVNETVDEVISDNVNENDTETSENETNVVSENSITNNDAVFGVVIAELLNVRENPSRDAVALEVIKKGDKIGVNVNESTDEWYKVSTDRTIVGYCMKKFIAID